NDTAPSPKKSMTAMTRLFRVKHKPYSTRPCMSCYDWRCRSDAHRNRSKPSDLLLKLLGEGNIISMRNTDSLHRFVTNILFKFLYKGLNRLRCCTHPAYRCVHALFKHSDRLYAQQRSDPSCG